MMPDPSSSAGQIGKSLPGAIFIAGLIAGILDIAAAMILFVLRGGKDPVKILNFIASGVFGKDGLTGGSAMAAMGLLFHMMIATIWAFIFFIGYPKLNILGRNWLLSGVAYGVIVWLGMNLIVVPLSRTPSMEHKGVIVGMMVIVICVGLPIAFLAHKFYKNRL